MADEQQAHTLKTAAPAPSEEADAALVARASSGPLFSRHQAFSVLVVRYERLLRSLLRSLGASAAEAEEITQDAYLIAWRKLSDLREPEHFLPWLKQIAYRGFLRCIRDRQRSTAMDDPALLPEASADDSPWIDRDLATLLGHCSAAERELLILCYGFGFTIAEIAAARGVASGTLKSQLHRARHKMKTVLEHDQAGGQHHG